MTFNNTSKSPQLKNKCELTGKLAKYESMVKLLIYNVL